MKKRTCSPSTPKWLSKRKAAIPRFFTRPWYGVETARRAARDKCRVGASQESARLEQMLDHLERDDDVPRRSFDGPGKLLDGVPPDVDAGIVRVGALDRCSRDLEPCRNHATAARVRHETAVARTAVEQPRDLAAE